MFKVGDKVVITNLKGYNGTNVPPEFKEGFVGEISAVGEGGWLGCYKLKGYLHYLSEHRIAHHQTTAEALEEEEPPVIAEEAPVRYMIVREHIIAADIDTAYMRSSPTDVILVEKDGRWVQVFVKLTAT